MQTAARIKKPPATIMVFADYACPLSYVGQARLTQLSRVLDLQVDWRFIEGRPDLPIEGLPIAALRMPAAEWRALMDNLLRMTRREKLPFREPARIANSRCAILLAEAARCHDKAAFDVLHRRLFAAHFGEGLDIGDAVVLRQLAAEAGLDHAFVEAAWRDPAHARRLRDNQETAQRIGLKATPAFVIGQQVLEGVVPAAMLAETLIEIQEPH